VLHPLLAGSLAAAQHRIVEDELEGPMAVKRNGVDVNATIACAVRPILA